MRNNMPVLLAPNTIHKSTNQRRAFQPFEYGVPTSQSYRVNRFSELASSGNHSSLMQYFFAALLASRERKRHDWTPRKLTVFLQLTNVFCHTKPSLFGIEISVITKSGKAACRVQRPRHHLPPTSVSHRCLATFFQSRFG